MKLLIIGANGQLGNAFLRSPLITAHQTLAVYTERSRPNPESVVCDLSQPLSIRKLFKSFQPDVVINAAAYTQVDRAEEEPAEARCVNAEGVKHLAEVCSDNKALLIHFSTDYVFSGVGTRAWREDDSIAPINSYGMSKWLGEQALQASTASYLIFRVSWLFSDHGHNFVKTIIKASCERDTLRVVDDQIGSPTSAHSIAELVLQCLDVLLSKTDLRHRLWRPHHGETFHLASRGETTWHGFAKAIVDEARLLGSPVIAEKIEAISSASFVSKAKRPVNSRLDCEKFERTFDLKRPIWQDSLRETLMKMANSIHS